MYAKIMMTTWIPDGRTVSTLKNGQIFEHERDCPMYERMNVECDCYVSRLRLVKIPTGEFIATTEPDLSADVKFWHEEAEDLRHRSNLLSIALMIASSVCLISLAGLVFELGLS